MMMGARAALRRRLDRLRGDEGLTLPEVIVVSIVTTIILIAVGGMYISTLRTERVISDLSQGASSAQLVARSIDSGVRNGVILDSVRIGSDGGQMLAVCTAGAGTTAAYSWRAWYYSPTGNGSIRSRDFASNAKPSVPSASQLSGWTLLLDGIDPRNGAGVFSVNEPNRTSARIAFAGEGARTDTMSATIEFAPNLAPHPTYAPGSEPCS
jgi:hypothetical protein